MKKLLTHIIMDYPLTSLPIGYFGAFVVQIFLEPKDAGWYLAQLIGFLLVSMVPAVVYLRPKRR